MPLLSIPNTNPKTGTIEAMKAVLLGIAAIVMCALAGPSVEFNIVEAGTKWSSTVDGQTNINLPDLCEKPSLCANCMNDDNSDLFVNTFKAGMHMDKFVENLSVVSFFECQTIWGSYCELNEPDVRVAFRERHVASQSTPAGAQVNAWVPRFCSCSMCTTPPQFEVATAVMDAGYRFIEITFTSDARSFIPRPDIFVPHGDVSDISGYFAQDFLDLIDSTEGIWVDRRTLLVLVGHDHKLGTVVQQAGGSVALPFKPFGVTAHNFRDVYITAAPHVTVPLASAPPVIALSDMDVSKCQTVEIDVANAVVNDNNNPFTSLVVTVSPPIDGMTTLAASTYGHFPIGAATKLQEGVAYTVTVAAVDWLGQTTTVSFKLRRPVAPHCAACDNHGMCVCDDPQRWDGPLCTHNLKPCDPAQPVCQNGGVCFVDENAATGQLCTCPSRWYRGDFCEVGPKKGVSRNVIRARIVLKMDFSSIADVEAYKVQLAFWLAQAMGFQDEAPEDRIHIISVESGSVVVTFDIYDSFLTEDTAGAAFSRFKEAIATRSLAAFGDLANIDYEQGVSTQNCHAELDAQGHDTGAVYCDGPARRHWAVWVTIALVVGVPLLCALAYIASRRNRGASTVTAQSGKTVVSDVGRSKTVSELLPAPSVQLSSLEYSSEGQPEGQQQPVIASSSRSSAPKQFVVARNADDFDGLLSPSAPATMFSRVQPAEGKEGSGVVFHV